MRGCRQLAKPDVARALGGSVRALLACGAAKLVEPDCSNALSGYLVHGDCLDNAFLETGDTLVIDDDVPGDHAIDNLRVKIRQRESFPRIVRSKCLLAR